MSATLENEIFVHYDEPFGSTSNDGGGNVTLSFVGDNEEVPSEFYSALADWKAGCVTDFDADLNEEPTA